MMSRRRLIAVYILIAIVLGGHLYDGVRFSEHWPFSNYPMYAGIVHSELVTYRLVCLTRGPDGSEREIPMEPRYFPSLPLYKVEGTLRRFSNGSQANPKRLAQMMGDYIAGYETRRKLGLHDGPPIYGLRLYKVDVPLEPAVNGGSLVEHPEKVLEYKQGERSL